MIASSRKSAIKLINSSSQLFFLMLISAIILHLRHNFVYIASCLIKDLCESGICYSSNSCPMSLDAWDIQIILSENLKKVAIIIRPDAEVRADRNIFRNIKNIRRPERHRCDEHPIGPGDSAILIIRILD